MSSTGETVRVRVWDRMVRLLHWTLVVSTALSALGLVVLFGLHQPAGYVALAAVLVRVAWGALGGQRAHDAHHAHHAHHAQFAQFVRGPRAVLRYARAVALRREPRFIGHNPLGGWMVVALLLCVIGLALTGWLYTTDAFFGDESVERAHRVLAWTLLLLVIAHLAGVLFTSHRHRENLVAAMFDGRKRAPAPDDIA